jgi:DNA-binding NarL/FixJ family response regulator
MSKCLRVGLVEGQELVRKLLKHFIAGSPGFEIVFEAQGVSEFYEYLRSTLADVVLLAVNLPDGDGLSACRWVYAQQIRLKCVLISERCTSYDVHRADELGVMGFISQGITPEILTEALGQVAAGRSFFSSEVLSLRRDLRNEAQSFPKILGKRELSLMPLFGVGMTDGEIATRTRLCVETIKWHRGRIVRKLGLDGIRDLMRYCLCNGFVRWQANGAFSPVEAGGQVSARASTLRVNAAKPSKGGDIGSSLFVARG